MISANGFPRSVSFGQSQIVGLRRSAERNFPWCERQRLFRQKQRFSQGGEIGREYINCFCNLTLPQEGVNSVWRFATEEADQNGLFASPPLK